jgi:Replication-relaxation
MTARRRTGHRELAELADSLSTTEREAIRVVYDFRLASGGQLQRLLCPAGGDSAARACRRLLERLTQTGLLARLERRIGGVRAGSHSYVYNIGPVGDRLMRRQLPRRRLRDPSWAFIDHTLAVTEFFTQITETTRDTTDVEIIAVQTEPACWRHFTGIDGAHILRPDLYLTLGIGELEHRWFIEIDRATEHLPAVLRKCAVYERYYRTNTEQDTHGVFPKVMWATTTDTRADQIARRLAASTLTTALFGVDTINSAAQRLTGAPQ